MATQTVGDTIERIHKRVAELKDTCRKSSAKLPLITELIGSYELASMALYHLKYDRPIANYIKEA